MATVHARTWRSGEGWVCCAMRDELSHALHEALYELDVLPEDESAALLALYAIMDDLRSALHRAQAMDAAPATV
jgi:hypothetical protein